ncbi:Membralin [Papilio machaon]|uniref:Membralin n=1 Tax=Papilio machaon TaxID=76193 RepID=A0A194RA66_PAPMA|nr:Membralin [Papilio machaon]
MSNAGRPNAMNNFPPGVNPENNILPGGPLVNQMMNRNNRNNNQNPLFNVRERLFHALFFKFAVAYARTFPRPIRRFFEFLVLLKALIAFFVLAYIHIAFSRTPTTCLNHVKDSWPRHGILRVEILKNPAHDYTIEQSYAKERKLKRDKEEFNSMLGILATEGFINIESSSNEDIKEDGYLRDGTDYGNITRVLDENVDEVPQDQIMETAYFVESKATLPDNPEPDLNTTIMPVVDVEPSTSIWQGIMGLVDELEEDSKISEESVDMAAANDSSRGVKIVTLDPQKDACFGDSFSRFVLEEFLGYDDLLMASIKTLAEQEDNKGYLRNVITGEHYRFVSMLTSRTSYIAAFFIMLVFVSIVIITLVVTRDFVSVE